MAMSVWWDDATIGPNASGLSAGVGKSCAFLARFPTTGPPRDAQPSPNEAEPPSPPRGILTHMQETLVRALFTRRLKITRHWEALLRVERANTPLAHPDTLVHLLDWALDEIFTALRSGPVRQPSPACPALSSLHTECSCGRNPLIAFYLAGEQAMLEALVLVQAALPTLDPTSRDTAVSELYFVLRRLRRREVDAFCSLCQHRTDHARPAAATTQTEPCSRSR